MGQGKSKPLKFPQYPQPPGYPPYYPYGIQQPPVGYAPGYHPPVLPPGYGPLMPQPQIPQMVGWPPPQRHTRRKKKRSSAPPAPAQPAHQPTVAGPGPNVQPAPPGMLDNLPRGFIPTSITPNPPGASGPVIPPAVPGNNTAQEPHTLRRAGTPFLPARNQNDGFEDDEDSEEDEQHGYGRSQSQSHRRAASEPHHIPDITANDPVASPGVRPNPLPPPPRDVYALSPYKQLLHLPNTMALLTARTAHPSTVQPNTNSTLTRSSTNPGMAGVGAGVNAVQPQTIKKKKKFFSFSSRRGRDPPAQPTQPHPPQHQLGNIQFVPVYQNAPHGQTSSGVAHASATPATQPQAGPSTGGALRPAEPPVPPVPASPSPPPRRSPSPGDDEESDDGMMPPDVYRSITPAGHPSHPASHQPQSQQPFHQPQPAQSQPPPQTYQFSQPSPSNQPYLVSPNGTTMEFSHTSLPDFLNHSPHRVMYANKIYPSAMHLHEAMKFTETKPELAETIRNTENVEDIYPFTARLQVWVRPDWGAVFLEKMEEVLWHKFTQHRDLRTMLLKTGNARIVYSDPADPYWGSGAPFGAGSNFPGTNYLGRLLEKVRDRLKERGYPAT